MANQVSRWVPGLRKGDPPIEIVVLNPSAKPSAEAIEAMARLLLHRVEARERNEAEAKLRDERASDRVSAGQHPKPTQQRRAMAATAIKWHGGKSLLASRILELAPPRVRNGNAPAASDPGYLHYVEPFAGGLAVLLANDPHGISEVANDLNGDLMNFWTCLRDPEAFQSMLRYIEATPFAEAAWDAARNPAGDPAERAGSFFIHCRQSLAGRMDSFTGITKARTRRGMSNEVSAWLTAVEGLPAFHERLRRVLLLNRPALEVVQGQDGERTWFYVDPPYLHATRTAPEVYRHEMTEAQHGDLLDCLAGIRGRFTLSGYRSTLYDTEAKRHGWRRIDIQIPNHAAGGSRKRRMTECLWLNY